MQRAHAHAPTHTTFPSLSLCFVSVTVGVVRSTVKYAVTIVVLLLISDCTPSIACSRRAASARNANLLYFVPLKYVQRSTCNAQMYCIY